MTARQPTGVNSMTKKMMLAFVFTLPLLILIGNCSKAPEGPKTPEEELIDALDLLIKYGEANQIDSLFKRFTPPADYKRLSDAGQLQVAMDRFSIFKYDFIRAMKEAKTVEPVFNEDTTRAEYEIVDIPVPGNKIVFGKINGQWYITD